MNRAQNGYFLCLALALAVLTFGCGMAAPKVLNIGGNFTLTDQNGKSFESSSLRGKIVLIFFGYTSCPDVCPTTMSKLASVYSDLGTDAARVQTVYISVDTRRDTPAVLKEYLANFKSLNAIGLTGTVPEIDKVTAMFGAQYIITPIPAAGASQDAYAVGHTTSIYALDEQERTRLIFNYDSPVWEFVAGIRALLKEAPRSAVRSAVLPQDLGGRGLAVAGTRLASLE